MKKFENECIGCATPLYPCRGESCQFRHVPHYYCDKCGGDFEPEALFVNEDGEELCMECFVSNYPTVKQLED